MLETQGSDTPTSRDDPAQAGRLPGHWPPTAAPLRHRPDPRDRRWLLKATLLLGLVYLGLIGTNVWLIWSARSNAIEQAHLANTNLARAVTQRVEATLTIAEHILNGIVYELESGDITPSQLQRLQPVLVNHAAGIAQLKSLFVYDAHGNWIATSEPSWSNASNNADRAYFIHHKNNASLQALLGLPLVSRSSNEWVLPVSRRLNDADGHFAGVVLVTVSIKQLLAMLEQFDIGAQGAITLAMSGHLIVRRPFVEAEIGSQTPQTALAAMAMDRNTRTMEGPSTIDGVPRLISFENLLNYDVRVSVASSKEEVLRHWRDASVLQTLWVVFLCVLLGLAGRYTRRSIQHRLAAERSLLATRDALSEANQQLAQLARHDGLTGLANRRYFDQRLDRCWRQALREKRSVALVMVDVDAFKKYNDRYGHVDGDACLQRVAAALLSAVQRPEDFVARYGGEEMAMLLPETDLNGAQAVAESARLAVAALKIPHAASAAGIVTVSLGVAAGVPGADATVADFVKAADAALYGAKHGGRNRVGVATAHGAPGMANLPRWMI